jgi:hypothetical protein
MKILAIKHLNVKQKDGSIKPSILVTTAQADIWVTPGQWNSAGAGSSLDSYNGGEIDAVYFTKGELLFDGTTECTDDNKILKSIFVKANPMVLAYAVAAEAQSKMSDASDMSALYARQRIASKAKEAAALLIAGDASKVAEEGKAIA